MAAEASGSTKFMSDNRSVPLAGTVTLFSADTPLKMEGGAELEPIEVAYETYGRLNGDKSNVILICHALSGNAHAARLDDQVYASINGTGSKQEPGWWEASIGPGLAFDTNKYFVVASNFLGSCYGTTGPASVNPLTGQKYGLDFPQMTVRDMVHVQRQLVQTLGIEKIAVVAGGSLGGMQALEWAIMYPEMVESVIPIATAAAHTPWAIGLNEVARQAIFSDPNWNGGRYTDQPKSGLALARMIAMISYRSGESFQLKFERELQNPDVEVFDPDLLFKVESYLRYQGKKFVDRFDANTYIRISRAMDLHDISRGRASVAEVLSNIDARVLCMGISTDSLYPASLQREMVASIPDVRYGEIESIHGHDAFLIEFEQLNRMIVDFLR